MAKTRAYWYSWLYYDEGIKGAGNGYLKKKGKLTVDTIVDVESDVFRKLNLKQGKIIIMAFHRVKKIIEDD